MSKVTKRSCKCNVATCNIYKTYGKGSGTKKNNLWGHATGYNGFIVSSHGIHDTILNEKPGTK